MSERAAIPQRTANYYLVQTKLVLEENSVSSEIDKDVTVYRESWEGLKYVENLDKAKEICKNKEPSSWRVLEIQNAEIQSPDEYVEKQNTYYKGHKNWVYNFLILVRTNEDYASIDNIEERRYEAYADAYKAWKTLPAGRSSILLEEKYRIVDGLGESHWYNRSVYQEPNIEEHKNEG